MTFFFINLYIYLPSLSVSNFIVYVITVSTVSYVLRKNCNATISVFDQQMKKEKIKKLLNEKKHLRTTKIKNERRKRND